MIFLKISRVQYICYFIKNYELKFRLVETVEG